ncbi:hypothetical protein RB595_000339 [Gaeumannomyces hyphopodioides]
MELRAILGRDCFLVVVEELVRTIGLRKALRLRAVDRAFNWAITYALCTSQVLPYSPWEQLPLFLNARIHLENSRKSHRPQDDVVASIAKLNEALDDMTLLCAGDEDRVASRHLLVAEALVSRRLRYETPLAARTVIELGYRAYTGRYDATDQSLLGGAIVIGDLGLARLLLDRNGPDYVSDMTCFGRPVILAAAYGRDDIFDLLLERGADVQPESHPYPMVDAYTTTMPMECRFIPRYTRGTALQAAASAGSEYILHRILSLTSHMALLPTAEYISTYYFHACILASRGGHLGAMDTLLRNLPENRACCQGLLRAMMQEACVHGQEKAVELLLNSGFDDTEHICDGTWGWFYKPGCCGIISIPVSHGNLAITRLLLGRGVSPYNKCDRALRQPILEASRNGHEHLVRLLLDANLGPDSSPPAFRLADVMCEAVSNREERLVKILLDEHGPEILAAPHRPGHRHHRDSYSPGYTLGHALLSSAIKVVSPELIELLVSLGVPLNKGWGSSPSSWPLWLARDRPWLYGFLRSLGAEEPTHRQGPAFLNQEFGQMHEVYLRDRFFAPSDLRSVGKH